MVGSVHDVGAHLCNKVHSGTKAPYKGANVTSTVRFAPFVGCLLYKCTFERCVLNVAKRDPSEGCLFHKRTVVNVAKRHPSEGCLLQVKGAFYINAPL